MRKDEFPIVDEYCRRAKIEELERINSYISHIRNTGMGKNKSLDFIEKFINEIKTERGE